jgi:hypothetical protein
MGMRVSQRKVARKENIDEVMQVAIVDGQAYAFGPQMKRNIPDDGIAAAVAAYATDDILQDLDPRGATEGWSRS